MFPKGNSKVRKRIFSLYRSVWNGIRSLGYGLTSTISASTHTVMKRFIMHPPTRRATFFGAWRTENCMSRATNPYKFTTSRRPRSAKIRARERGSGAKKRNDERRCRGGGKCLSVVASTGFGRPNPLVKGKPLIPPPEQ